MNKDSGGTSVESLTELMEKSPKGFLGSIPGNILEKVFRRSKDSRIQEKSLQFLEESKKESNENSRRESLQEYF